MTTVDVVVPCYNYAHYLHGCVASVLSQEGVAVRLLVIDDASSDNTARVAAELAAADDRVEFRRHAENKGHIATYNEGLLGWATADYTVLLSADDRLAPGSLSRAVRIMNADETIGMVYGRSFYFADDAELHGIRGRELPFTRWTGAEWLEGRCRAGHNVISSPEVVVRGRVQRAVGGYRPELPHAADLEMWLRIAAIANIAYVRGIPQAFYRRHGASMTTARTRLIDLRERKDAFDIFFRRHADLTNAARLHSLANRALAREALWNACRAYDRNRVEEAGAQSLIDFAMDAFPAATSLPEHRALRRRQRLGSVVCSRSQLFAAPALVKRVRKWLWWRRWERTGV